MPTPTGLPMAGEVWKRTTRLPPDWAPHVIVFKVIQRGRGDYWPMHVQVLTIDGEKPAPTSPAARQQLWVDCAYWWQRGELELVEER